MNRLPLLVSFSLLFLCSLFSFSQTGYLFVKKGIKKKSIYTEGDAIHLRLQDESLLKGTITLLRNDTIFVNGHPVTRVNVKEVLLEKRPKKPFPDAKTIAVIAAGSALTSAGLAISEQARVGEALLAGPVIGFGPLLIRHFGGGLIRSFHRKKFRIRKKFYLQVLDFHLPGRQLKSF